ncbi:hypothetical protein TWF718_007858 [Orbilia javanica]|uniref:Uncharacterized protein n=1 Tax=Orbilia javanica TaxID=47235 RepID=A0AAN8MMA2_9PEZI
MATHSIQTMPPGISQQTNFIRLYRHRRTPRCYRGYQSDKNSFGIKIGPKLRPHEWEVELTSYLPTESAISDPGPHKLKLQSGEATLKGLIYGWPQVYPVTSDWKRLYNIFHSFVYKENDEHIKRVYKKATGLNYPERDREHTIWAVRGYMIGPDQGRAPPYFVVLSNEPSTSKALATLAEQAIPRAAKQKKYINIGEWQVMEFNFGNFTILKSGDEQEVGESLDTLGEGSTTDSDDSSSLHGLEVIKAKLVDGIPKMASEPLQSWLRRQHRCGIRLEADSGSEAPKAGTLGGIVKVRGRLYGLTVGHIFTPTRRADQAADEISETKGDDNHNTSRDETDGTEDDDNTSQKDADEIEDDGDDDDENDDDDDANLEREELELEASELRRDMDLVVSEQGQYYSMDLDWALVELPDLAEDAGEWEDLNLVQTIHGDFHPIFATPEEPRLGTMVNLATPGATYGLRGYYAGSNAAVNMPGAHKLYNVWVLRMEYPWLIQNGDSGSWAFDPYNGSLIGILIAGCPKLLEAYIVPAYRVFDSIGKRFGGVDNVDIANDCCLSADDRTKLRTVLQSYPSMKQQINSKGGFRNWTGIETDIKELEPKISSLREEGLAAHKGNVSDPINPSLFEKERLTWLSSYIYTLGALEFVPDEILDTARATFGKEPLSRYNSVNKIWKEYLLGKYGTTIANQRLQGEGPYESRSRQPDLEAMAMANMIDMSNSRDARNAMPNVALDNFILDKNEITTRAGSRDIARFKDMDIKLRREQAFLAQVHWGFGDRRLITEFVLRRPNWNAHSPKLLFKFLAGNLRNEITLKRSFESHFLDVSFDVKQDGPFVLLGVFVVNENRDQILMIESPDRNPSFLDEASSHSTIKTFGTPHEELDDSAAEGPSNELNSLRLGRQFHRYIPLALWNPSGTKEDACGQLVSETETTKEESVRKLIQDKLYLKDIHWKQEKQLNLEPSYYPSDDTGDIAMEFYEVVLEEKDWPSQSVEKADRVVTPFKISDLKEGRGIPKRFYKALENYYNVELEA